MGRRIQSTSWERLQELIEAYSVDPEDVLKVLPELLTGEARPLVQGRERDVADSQ